MKSISQKLQDDIRAVMEANLHPNQQKIDVHEPEKDEITAHDFKKLRAMKKTPDGKVHDCATHVEHTELGKGVTISEQHAEPDESGNIEWYAVQFDSGVYKVYTEDMDIIVSEAHHHGGKMKKENTEMVNELSKKTLGSYIKKNVSSQSDLGYQHGADPEEYQTDPENSRKATNRETGLNKAVKRLTKEDTDNQIQELAGKAAQQAAIAISLIKAGKKDGKMPKPMKEDSVQEEEKKKPVSPFDYKNYKSEIPKKPGELTGHDSKKISTGTVYTKKPVKEESHQSKTTMKHIPNASPALKKAAKDIKPGVAGYKDRVDMLKAGGVKEEVEQEEYTFADYLEAARAQYVDEDAVLVANEAFKNKDITLFIDQSQSPEA